MIDHCSELVGAQHWSVSAVTCELIFATARSDRPTTAQIGIGIAVWRTIIVLPHRLYSDKQSEVGTALNNVP
jgi:hypothetical protein